MGKNQTGKVKVLAGQDVADSLGCAIYSEGIITGTRLNEIALS